MYTSTNKVKPECWFDIAINFGAWVIRSLVSESVMTKCTCINVQNLLLHSPSYMVKNKPQYHKYALNLNCSWLLTSVPTSIRAILCIQIFCEKNYNA